ncbi:FecR family protein [Desulfobacterales bacterium HSG17]|nr:FecR family protein [Desulfobacterales bacterium HSG17]
MQKKMQIFVMLLILVCPLAASHAAETKGMGQVTAYTGDVIVRTNGKWAKLKKIPHTLYSSDKVVTNRGRAQVQFHDGDVIKLDIDSNISMNEEKGTESKSMLRQVNLLIGKMHFNIKPKKKGSKLQFKTPTVTAGIRGTAGGLEVNSKGETAGGLSNGSWATDGSFEPVPQDQISEPDVNTPSNALPPSNPEIANSDLQKAAVKATQRREAALRAIEDAKARLKNTDKNNIKELALAAAAKAEAASALATADILSGQEILSEAERMGDEQGIEKANEVLDNFTDLADNAAEAAQNASQMADSSLSAKTPEAAEAYAFSALAFGSAAAANASATNAGVNVAEIAVSDNDPERMSKSEDEMNRASARAKQATESAQNANDNAKEAANANSVINAKNAAAAARNSAAQAEAHAEVAQAAAAASEALSMKDSLAESETQSELKQKEETSETVEEPVLIEFEQDEDETAPSLEDNETPASPV